MPARNPSGAATSPETRMTGASSRMGCQPNQARSPTTIPKPIAPNRQVIQAARIQPGLVRRRSRPPLGGAGACTSFTATAVTCFDSPLLARAYEELNERVQLHLRERGAEVRRHHVLRVPGLDVLVRIDDRLVDERFEW